jgi:hypothetical protein
MISLTEKRVLKWKGIAHIGNNDQEVVCRAEQQHTLPWNHVQDSKSTIHVFCENLLVVLNINFSIRIFHGSKSTYK